MRVCIRIFFTLLITYGVMSQNYIIGQDLMVKVGYREIIKSKILNEDREILVHLPDNYKDTDKAYPVLYRLDGNVNLLLETLAVVNRLAYSDELAPEMIIVTIKNINRDKDMWPVNSIYYPQPQAPGAHSFLSFISEELLPYIDSKYRTDNNRIICGQSLSSVFVLYTFLEQPELFDSFIAISGAFPECDDYFSQLCKYSFLQKNKFGGKKIFITNGMKDPLDPDRIQHNQMQRFSNILEEELKGEISLYYKTYMSEGHVPFHSLYDALKFIY